jgi:hypothetical protein
MSAARVSCLAATRHEWVSARTRPQLHAGDRIRRFDGGSECYFLDNGERIRHFE